MSWKAKWLVGKVELGWTEEVNLSRCGSVEVYESTLHPVNKALCLCKKLIEFLVRPMFNYTST